MAERQPRLVENCTYQYDDAKLQPADRNALIPWTEALTQLSSAQTYWWATVRSDGRPHVRPVLAVWVEGAMCTTSRPSARKAQNLATNNACVFTAATDGIDFIIEGTAARVTDRRFLSDIADAYHTKYGWPVTITEGGFTAPYGAPAAGPPPYQPYAITPTTIYAFGTDERFARHSTRYRF